MQPRTISEPPSFEFASQRAKTGRPLVINTFRKFSGCFAQVSVNRRFMQFIQFGICLKDSMEARLPEVYQIGANAILSERNSIIAAATGISEKAL